MRKCLIILGIHAVVLAGVEVAFVEALKVFTPLKNVHCTPLI